MLGIWRWNVNKPKADMSHPDIYLRKSVKTVNHSRFILFILDSY